jgi:antitoxin component YwqK of YwqJK toxin-antitoxin module
MEGRREEEVRDGVPDGLARVWSADGTLREERWYDYGTLRRERRWDGTGRCEDAVLDYDGQVVKRYAYPAGVRVDDAELDHDVDTLTYRNGERFTGIAVERHADGWVLHETEYRLGIPDGVARTYWPGGGVRHEHWTDYGIGVRRRAWHRNGQLGEDLVMDHADVIEQAAFREDGRPLRRYRRRRRPGTR